MEHGHLARLKEYGHLARLLEYGHLARLKEKGHLALCHEYDSSHSLGSALPFDRATLSVMSICVGWMGDNMAGSVCTLLSQIITTLCTVLGLKKRGPLYGGPRFSLD